VHSFKNGKAIWDRHRLQTIPTEKTTSKHERNGQTTPESTSAGNCANPFLGIFSLWNNEFNKEMTIRVQLDSIVVSNKPNERW